MIYSWKTGYFKTPAQAAGEELERIQALHGKLTAKSVVEESRKEEAVLHKEFEWDDSKAAEQFRESQARMLIGNLVIAYESPKTSKPTQVRAYIHTPVEYKRIDVVISNNDDRDYMFRKALSELSSFKTKYATLSEFERIFDEINHLLEAS